ncbi:unnamed protein product [Ilex paraguariensis]|uniref:Uncharacterized protein n=1 Tax=Ilex paraguariensis TaxID=185542 RepID=A0ABC8R8V3_9AQUA
MKLNLSFTPEVEKKSDRSLGHRKERALALWTNIQPYLLHKDRSVVVGSFMADGRKQSKSGQAEGLISPPKLASGASGGSPQSRGTLSESSGGPGSPLNQSTGACNNNNPQGMATMPWR